MANAIGMFEITSMHEAAYHEGDGDPKLTRANGSQRFSGDIAGDGSVEWLMCYTVDGTARFVGLQRIAGSIDGHAGSFVAEAVGDHDGKQSKGTWSIIPGSGTGGLSGISGEGTFHAPGGPEVSYSLEFRLG